MFSWTRETVHLLGELQCAIYLLVCFVILSDDLKCRPQAASKATHTRYPIPFIIHWAIQGWGPACKDIDGNVTVFQLKQLVLV